MSTLEPQPIGIPVPRPSPRSADYWAEANRGHLTFQRCTGCGYVGLRSLAVCARCLDANYRARHQRRARKPLQLDRRMAATRPGLQSALRSCCHRARRGVLHDQLRHRMRTGRSGEWDASRRRIPPGFRRDIAPVLQARKLTDGPSRDHHPARCRRRPRQLAPALEGIPQLLPRGHPRRGDRLHLHQALLDFATGCSDSSPTPEEN